MHVGHRPVAALLLVSHRHFRDVINRGGPFRDVAFEALEPRAEWRIGAEVRVEIADPHESAARYVEHNGRNDGEPRGAFNDDEADVPPPRGGLHREREQ